MRCAAIEGSFQPQPGASDVARRVHLLQLDAHCQPVQSGLAQRSRRSRRRIGAVHGGGLPNEGRVRRQTPNRVPPDPQSRAATSLTTCDQIPSHVPPDP